VSQCVCLTMFVPLTQCVCLSQYVCLSVHVSPFHRGDMRGYNFGAPAGTTTWGGSGVTRYGGPLLNGGGTPGVTRFTGPMMNMQGDPGFFDFVGRQIKSGLGIVSKLGIPLVSGLAGTAGSLLSGGGGQRGPGFQQIPLTLMQQQGTPMGVRKGGALALGQRIIPGGETGMGAGCGSGYRPNKSGYYVNGGQFVAPGSVCVKRRRMNPLNPRALSKAMRRIESAKRATTVLSRITIRKKC